MTRERLILLVDNETGVLVKIAALFASKNCNIEAITSTPTDDPAVLMLTVEVPGDGYSTARLCSLLAKMLPVHSVERVGVKD